MSLNTGIEWTDATWNPWHGCHKVSQGCKNCYMFRQKRQYGSDGNIVLRSKTKFKDPLKWPKVPTLCFTCSWSDWLIEEADAWREEAYEIIRQTPWITYQILTKRIDRADGRIPDCPLPNVWLGVSVENFEAWDARVHLLKLMPAAKRFISYEPALADLGCVALEGIDWLICGGESGPGAHPMHPDWARAIRDSCVAAGVPFFFKQWGEYGYWDQVSDDVYRELDASGEPPSDGPLKLGKKRAGALLDGREWRQFPL